MTAAVDVAVIRGEDQRVVRPIEVVDELAELFVGPCDGGGVFERARAEGVAFLVDIEWMNEHEIACVGSQRSRSGEVIARAWRRREGVPAIGEELLPPRKLARPGDAKPGAPRDVPDRLRRKRVPSGRWRARRSVRIRRRSRGSHTPAWTTTASPPSPARNARAPSSASQSPSAAHSPRGARRSRRRTCAAAFAPSHPERRRRRRR